jgi:hypothetical protein
MKFKTFRCITALVALCVVVGGFVGISRLGGFADDAPAAPEVVVVGDEPRAETPPADTSGPPPSAAPDDPNALRSVDEKVLARIKGSISGAKVKDAFKSEVWKANLYQDTGFSSPNRVKVDLDRDDRWDEKWTVEDGRVKREVSPDDDGANYTLEYHLAGDRWTLASNQPETPPLAEPKAVAPARGEGQALRALDEKILALVERGISGSKRKDAFSGEPWKVNLYAEGGKVTRLKLDLDRDETWDESWTFETPGSRAKVKRQVSPDDDDVRSLEYRLQAGRWIKKS